MKHINSIIIVAFCFCSIIFTSCEKDPSSKPAPVINEADEINTFIWNGLHDYYLWTKNVPNLNKSYFTSNQKNSDSLNSFLNKYTDHEKLFYDLLYDYGKTDKFSWIVDDYEVLEKEFEGITKSMGYNFMLGRYGSGTDVFGYVRYVVKGTPAAAVGLKRGDIFTKVNDQQLTLSNYRDLLINSLSYKLSFAGINNRTLVPNGISSNVMTAVEVTEDPIFLDTVYNVSNQKIGYLIYNSFTSNYDKKLNDVILKFKNEGITKLILDLRYNGGGSVQTATYLASMLYGTYTNKVFLKTEYNELLQNYILQNTDDDLNIMFESQITSEDDSKTPINTLNLSQITIITTDNSASASESIIVGLKPYMNVVTVGDTTYGKYVGSITLKDYIDDKGNVNPNHKWAMQPIVLKISNSNGLSDYVDGLIPQILIEEDIANLSVLGDLNEPLLKIAVNNITGVLVKSAKQPSQLNVKIFSESEDLIHKKEMYYNSPLLSGKRLGK